MERRGAPLRADVGSISKRTDTLDRRGSTQLLADKNLASWVNLHDSFVPLKCGDFIWASEASGFRHLTLHSASGALKTTLTSGRWVVDMTCSKMVDEEGGFAYFVGNRDDPKQAHLFRVPLAGGAVKQVTAGGGTHSVKLNRTFDHFVDRYHSVCQPVVVRLCSLADGSVLRVLHSCSTEPDVIRLRPHLLPPKFVFLPSSDGSVSLQAALYIPPSETYGKGPHPTIVCTYGGPGVQSVANSWLMSADLRAQYLRLKGYLVLKLDNRGSARRGHAFEAALLEKMGSVELDDQAAGVAWCVKKRLTDPKRVGIYGWSYGGYMAAMALCKYPTVFKAAVAGAPVTSWDGYDTTYTERYMSLPQENEAGYKESSVMTHVDKLVGKLMLVHGMIDENVHFRHTARLITALTRARKEYELLLFPDERHLPRSAADRVYMEQRIEAFFVRYL